MNPGCGWCASRNLSDRGTVVSSERHPQEWMTSRLPKSLPKSLPHDTTFKWSWIQNPGCVGEHLGLHHQCTSSALDAVRHTQLAMNNNPLHTTASGGNLGPVFLGVDWVLFSLSTIIVILRLYTRLWITRNFGLDDATIALTQARNFCSQRIRHVLTANM